MIRSRPSFFWKHNISQGAINEITTFDEDRHAIFGEGGKQ